MQQKVYTKNHIITVFGIKGYGKSYYIKHVLLPKAQFQKRIIIDFTGEYAPYGEVFTTPQSAIAYIITKRNQEIQEHKNVNYSAVCQFRDMEDYKLMFAAIVELDNYTLVLDEIFMFIGVNRYDENLYNLYNLSRHSNANLIAASRRPAQVGRIVTSQSDKVIVFRLKEPADLEYIAKFSSKETAQAVSRLPKEKYITIT